MKIKTLVIFVGLISLPPKAILADDGATTQNPAGAVVTTSTTTSTTTTTTSGPAEAVLAAAQNANPVAGQNAADQNFQNNKKSYCDRVKTNSKDNQDFPGSSPLLSCQNLTNNAIQFLYPAKRGRSGDFLWAKHIGNNCCESSNDSSDQASFSSCIQNNIKLAKSCESSAYIIHQFGRDWQDEEHAKATSRSRRGTQDVQVAQNGTITGGASFDCTSLGVETVDYEGCVEFKKSLENINAGQVLINTAQEVNYQGKTMSAQAKYSAEENTATGALKAQGESFKEQENIYSQRMGIDGAKLAYLYSIYNKIPRQKDVDAKCGSFRDIPVDFNDSFIQVPSFVITSKDCSEAAKARSKFAFLQNQDQLDTMESQLVKVATSLGENTILAALSKKRANQIKDAIADIEDFKPIDPFIVSEEEATSTLCKMNPTLPQCNNGELVSDFDHISDNVIVFGDGATGTSYGSSNIDSNGNFTNDAISKTTTKDVGSVGTAINPIDKSGSIEDSQAAKVTSKGTGEQGGGGGGGAGGATSTGAGTPPAQNAEGATAAISGRTPTYAGGAGSISVVGGMGINRKKADGKDENPFGKLFGKDGNKGAGVVNFRDPASQKVGAKGDNLFDMISNRYGSVTSEKRLLEYELKN